jgi:predicted TIM-barrel fold metal-dependent hydrolase
VAERVRGSSAGGRCGAPPRGIDCHVHVIDPVRFPYADGPGYKPRPGEAGTREALRAVLDAHHIRHALLVQPSCYGFANAALLDALGAAPGRYRAIAMVDPGTPDRELEALGEAGVVGVRFNLVSYQGDALHGAAAARFLARLRALGWFAQVYADDRQWPEAAAVLRRSGVKVLIDHFGVRRLAGGLGQAGFQAVLALGRDGGAVVKLSAPFRLSGDPGRYTDVAPFADAVIAAFGVDRCVWGSDWPFINFPGEVRYADALGAVARWLPDPADRERVLWHNPVRLFGFPP